MHAKSTALLPPEDEKDFLRVRPLHLRGLEDFCQRMGIGLKSGVDILRVLEMEGKRGTSQHRQIMEEVITNVRNGGGLAEALQKTGGYFPRMLVQMVAAGEMGGGLERVFLHMSEYYQDLAKSRSRFLQQIILPVIQLVFALGVISLVIVLQEITNPSSGNPNDLQFDASGIGLRGFSGLAIFWGIASVVFGGLAIVAYGIWKNWFGSHQLLMPFLLKLPIIGTVLGTSALSRLSITLSMLLNAGVEARRCLKEAFRSTGNQYFIDAHPAADAVIKKGQSFADAFDATKVMPEEFVRAVEVGEMSGTETDSLERLATEYNRRAKAALTQLAIASSATIWVGIAVFIIFMIIRMFMSYVNLLNNAGKI